MQEPKKLFIFFTLIILIISCDKESNPTGYEYPDLDPTNRGELLESVEVATLTKSDIAALLRDAAGSFGSEDGNGGGINLFAILGLIKNDVTIYKVFYSSMYDDEPVVLSGLVIAPVVDTLTTHLQYHHGSLRPYEIKDQGGLLDAPSKFEGEAPSGKKEQIETMLLCLIPASRGYFVSAPDYPGYGISEHKEHPYCYSPALAKTSADMFLAARELSASIKLDLNDKNLLTGVSEGGLVSLATHNTINKEYPSIEITASSNYAGPYNLAKFFQYFITQEEDLASLELYNWALYTYWKRNKSLFTDSIWTYQVQNQDDALEVPSNFPADIYTAEFINSAISDTGKLISEIQKMNVYRNWYNKGLVYLHHGVSDQTVPIFNTDSAYANLVSQGVNVERYRYSGNHTTAVVEYFINTMNDFGQLVGNKLLVKSY